MRKRLLCPVALLAMAAPLAPCSASAAPVLVPGPGGRTQPSEDPFLTTPPMIQGPPSRSAPPRAVPADRTVRGELTRLYRTRAIDRWDYRHRRAEFEAALATVRRLGGTRAVELEGVITNLHRIAATGQLSASRLPALFLTLERNRQWWTQRSLLSPGDRIEFPGSELVWEYYPGQGIELQELASFAKADGLYRAGSRFYPRLRQLLAELIPLAADRGGALTWEYYFSFDGASPPWTSAMSQATALEALTRAYRAFSDRSYLSVAHRALAIFGIAPPVGVTVRTRLGARYLLYSFAPGVPVINGFLQTLIGLYDYAQASGEPRARRLFAAGDVEARAELSGYDTGAWSLYQPGQEDTLAYHRLVTGFIHELCARTGALLYCTTALHFDSELTTPPALRLLTHRGRGGRATSIRFWLSKASHVGIVMLRGGQTVFLTSADFPYGHNSFAVPSAGPAGPYTIRLAATDLAGNFSRIVGTLELR